MQGGTAVEGEDYEDFMQMEHFIRVNLIDDDHYEHDETIFITIDDSVVMTTEQYGNITNTTMTNSTDSYNDTSVYITENENGTTTINGTGNTTMFGNSTFDNMTVYDTNDTDDQMTTVAMETANVNQSATITIVNDDPGK